MDDYRKTYEGKKILVTGGAGAIGSNLTRALAECGANKVIVIDNLSSAEKWNIPALENVLFVQGDICDEELLKRVFLEAPEYVFHLAAFFANQNSIDHPEKDLSVNGFGTLKLLQHSQLAGVRRFTFASSSSIYGGKTPLPITEDFMSLHLTTPYQITKLLGELYCNFFNHQYDLPVVKTRFFNSYGPGEIPGQYRNVIPNFIFWALNKMPLPISGTGEETRDFTYVADIVDGLLRAGHYEKAIGEDFNLATGREIQIGELARRINKLTCNNAGIIHVAKRKWDKRDRVLPSIKKARKLIHYAPETSFNDGLKNTIHWFRTNWEHIRASASFPPGTKATRVQ